MIIDEDKEEAKPSSKTDAKPSDQTQKKTSQTTKPTPQKKSNIQFLVQAQQSSTGKSIPKMPGITTTNPYASSNKKNLASKLSELAKKPSSNTQPNPSTPHPLNPIFISRPKCSPTTKEVTFKTDKKFESFFKIRLPKIQSNTPGPQEEEVTKAFQTVFTKLQTTDSSLVLYTWNRGTRLSSLKKGQQLPKTREDLKEYVDKVWLQKGCSPWV